MTYLDGFTIQELEDMLAAFKNEFTNGSVTSISSLGTTGTFSRMPLMQRLDLVLMTLKRKYPQKYGRLVKRGMANYYPWTF